MKYAFTTFVVLHFFVLVGCNSNTTKPTVSVDDSGNLSTAFGPLRPVDLISLDAMETVSASERNAATDLYWDCIAIPLLHEDNLDESSALLQRDLKKRGIDINDHGAYELANSITTDALVEFESRFIRAIASLNADPLVISLGGLNEPCYAVIGPKFDSFAELLPENEQEPIFKKTRAVKNPSELESIYLEVLTQLARGTSDKSGESAEDYAQNQLTLLKRSLDYIFPVVFAMEKFVRESEIPSWVRKYER